MQFLICLAAAGASASCFYLPQAAFLVWVFPAPVLFLLFRKGLTAKRTVFIACAFALPFLFLSYLVGFNIDVGFDPKLMFLIDFALVIIVSLVQGIPLALALFLGARLPAPFFARPFLMAALWTGAEWLTTQGVFAFPVRILAVSQWAYASNLGIMSVFGALFVSFLIVLTAALIAAGLQRFMSQAVRKPLINRGSLREGTVYLLTAGLVVALSFSSTLFLPQAESVSHVELIAVQHNAPMDSSARARFDIAMELAESALLKPQERQPLGALSSSIGEGHRFADADGDWQGGDLLLFPESTASFLRTNTFMQEHLSALARQYEVDILIGGANRNLDEETGKDTKESSQAQGDGSETDSGSIKEVAEEGAGPGILENAVYYIDRDGQLSDRHYVKQHLVPFFENGNIRPFSFSVGRERGVFESAVGKAGVIVCFESLIPSIVRETVNQGAEFIVIPTNDAYMGSDAIREMHFAQNILRSVETGCAVVQVAIDGVTGIAYPDGRTAVLIENGAGGSALVSAVLPMREACVLKAGIDLYDRKTPYLYIGELWLAVLLAASAAIVAFRGCAPRRVKPDSLR